MFLTAGLPFVTFIVGGSYMLSEVGRLSFWKAKCEGLYLLHFTLIYCTVVVRVVGVVHVGGLLSYA